MAIKRAGAAIFIVGFSIMWAYFALCGIVQLFQKPTQTEILNFWKERTIALELKIEEYERLTKALPILRQLITPVGWVEIEALAERNRQERNARN